MANHLTDRDVKWALKHLDQFGDTDLFPRPFEIDVLTKNADAVVKHVRALDLAQHKWVEPRRALVLKDELSFRSAAQLDPLDGVIFAAIIRHDARRLEKRRGMRVGRVFSYPVEAKADGQLYGPDGFRAFWTESDRLAASAKYILATDISDFYNQLYHHTLEQEFAEAGIERAAGRAVLNLLKRCSATTSRGVPIGPHGAHLLAEVSLRQVDELLVQRGFTYTRFVDDIHVFCEDKDDAYRALHLLAEVLDLVKLQLNRSKTRLLTIEEWGTEARGALEDHPINDDERALIERLNTAGSAGPYAILRQQQLTKQLQARLKQTRVVGIINAYLDQQRVDYIRLRWFLRRLTQTCTPAAVDIVVDRFSELAPAAADAVRYLRYGLPNYSGDKPALGGKLLRVLNEPAVASSSYLRVIVLSLFARVADLNHVPGLTNLYPSLDAAAQREVILAATNAGADAWLRTLKPLANQDPWVRRAIILSSVVWSDDERSHWLRSIKGSYGFLTDLVIDSVRAKHTAKEVRRQLTGRPKRLEGA